MEHENSSLPAREDGARRRAEQRRRRYNRLLAYVFFGIVAVFALVNLLVPDKDFSENENRALAQRPAFSKETLADGSYFSDLTSWYADQFFARDGWISLRLREDQLLGRKESGGVYLGRDGYLLQKPETPDETATARTAEAVRAFAAAYPGLSMHMLLAPDAAAAQPEHLPKNAPVRDQLADIAAVQTQLGDAVDFLDVSAALAAHPDEQLYYRTDHHWTSLGAYVAFSAAAPGLGIDAPIADYQVYSVSDSFRGTLSSKSGSRARKDTIQVYVPATDVQYYVYYPDTQTKSRSMYVSEKLAEKDQYTIFFGGNHAVTQLHTTAGNGRSLLVFKDSYANCFMQFLTPYYEDITMVDPRYYYDDVRTLLNAGGVTDVLFLYSADTYFTDTALADVLNAALEAE